MDASGAEIAPVIDREGLIQAFAEALGKRELEAAEAEFIEQALDHFRKDELPGWSEGDLAAMFADIWRFAAASGTAGGLRLTKAPANDPEGRRLDLLVSVRPDSPFLVDSLMGELAAQGLEVEAMFHPVVAQGDGRLRSVIAVVLGAVGEDRRQGLLSTLEGVLAEVRAAVDDFPAMTRLMAEATEALEAAPPEGPADERAEQVEFLRWLTSDRFIFLGARVYTYPRAADGTYLREEPQIDHARSLGVLRDPDKRVLRRASEPAVLAASPEAYLKRSPAVVVAKANVRSRVHRRVYMDYVGVRRYAADGTAAGEIRFVGLFTAEAYEEPTRSLPLIRRKVAQVLDRTAALCSDHAQRRLRNILETYPRDELFQIAEDELYGIVLGVLHLSDRPRVQLFTRRDPFDRYLSVLVFVPRERYGSDMQARVGEILAGAWNGRVSAVYPSFSDGPLARLHYIIGVHPGGHPEPDLSALEAAVVDAVRTWEDRFEAALREEEPLAAGVAETLQRWSGAFPPGYRDRNDAADALADLAELEAWREDEPLRVQAFRRAEDDQTRFRFKLYVRGEPAPLSDVLPILEHMGLRVLEEAGFDLEPRGEAPIWVHEYVLEDAHGQALAAEDLDGPFEEAFLAVWTGRTESDGFNRLVLELGVSWRQAALIRALARWRQQSGLDPSQSVQEASVRDNPGVARLILDLFAVKFDPAAPAAAEARARQADAIWAEIEAALQGVESLDADRVLRRLAGAVRAMTRTNYYQLDGTGAPKAHIAFKFDSKAISDLPAPRPFREAFVASPRVEGVHLRFGPVARGGLRWSDRRDDYRTEVLGLVKAQQVKNAVIVPVGAKGGFYPKKLPREGGAAARAEAVEAYKVYLAGLLDMTDNLDADGRVVRPEGVIAHDADDPYLVVAADKGTASFSDIANAAATERGFWLGDAFASGGSAGYDHKAMGITARGAWEAVKRHFRELGKDIQAEPFTCVGVGDMSGDVFGNGMLQSKATQLVAAFDHRHVFLDPSPDPESSWAERKRLFEAPASSWADYDPKLISPGGGVFPRTAKSVALTPEVRALLDIEDEALTPADLIRAILKAPVELLYLGGIGAYVKSPAESHAEVMDKANDAVRVDATELRCRVVGEGANLGFTQAGRIAYARAGGRINTDAIDNSAGVDTSDHEVNIKILLGQAERAGKLTRQARDELLRAMTDDVARHVLSHNYAQTLALSLQQASAAEDLDAHAHFMAELSAAGRLDVRVEGLPRPAAIAELKAQGQGLTRPELAVLTAYSKLELSDALQDSAAPDDPWFEATLEGYFPAQLKPFEPERRAHPLRRDIVSTVIANRMVDMAGATFPWRLKAGLACDVATIAVAFEAARAIFRLDETWAGIGALDLELPAEAQMQLYLETVRILRIQTYWLAYKAAPARPPSVAGLVDAYRPAADALLAAGDAVLSGYERDRAAAARTRFVEAGAPEGLARTVAALGPMTATVEIADLAQAAGWPVEATARLFHCAGAAFGLDRLKGAAASLRSPDRFERTAVRRLIAELVQEQTAITRAVAAAAGAPPADDATAVAAVDAWTAGRATLVERARRAIEEIEASGDGWSFAKLTIANAALRDLAG